MSDAPFQYKRLPGRGRRYQGILPVGAGRCSLWLGPDHLLSVERLWANERYKRFYFRDIQALTILRTNTANAWNWGLGTLAFCTAALFGALGANANTRIGERNLLVTGGIITGIWLLFLLINLARGASCICNLRTAVQLETLPSLGRVRAADRTFAILKPWIEQTQGQFSPEDLSRPIPPPPPPAEKVALHSRSSVQLVQPPRPGTGRIHAVLYAIMLEDALIGFIKAFHPLHRFFFDRFSGLQSLALLVLAIVAVTRQRDHSVSKALHRVTVLAVIEVPTFLVVSSSLSFFTAFNIAFQHSGHVTPDNAFHATHQYHVMMIIANSIESLIGIAGAALTVAWISKMRHKPLPEAPLAPPA